MCPLTMQAPCIQVINFVVNVAPGSNDASKGALQTAAADASIRRPSFLLECATVRFAERARSSFFLRSRTLSFRFY